MVIIMYYNLQAEQMAIHMSNNESDSQLTWVQTRNMPVTHKVNNTVFQDLKTLNIVLQ